LKLGDLKSGIKPDMEYGMGVRNIETVEGGRKESMERDSGANATRCCGPPFMDGTPTARWMRGSLESEAEEANPQPRLHIVDAESAEKNAIFSKSLSLHVTGFPLSILSPSAAGSKK
jgi:hypothetical protein